MRLMRQYVVKNTEKKNADIHLTNRVACIKMNALE